jgi:DUF4097 and DUF4098 domain-containing protein YvlB
MNKAHASILCFGLCFLFAAPFGESWAIGESWANEISHRSAREVRFKDIPLEFKEGDRLVISGVRGHVRLTVAADGKTGVLRARKTMGKSSPEAAQRFESANFGISRDGAVIVIQGKGPESKDAWASWVKDGGIDLNLELEIPSMPSEIHLREGQLTVQSWKHNVTANLVSGQIRVAQSEGHLNLQIQRGDVRVEGHRGRVELDSYSARLVVQDLEGDLDLTNFTGESVLSGLRGNVDTRTHSGATSVAKSSGSMEFQNGRGALNLNGFEGPVRGKNDQGAVTLALEGEAEVAVESNLGPVAVRLPANSGAVIRLSSEDGAISAPEAVKTGGGSAVKSAMGRLAGDGPKGRVEVRTKSGGIRVR